nr:RecName: Full=Hemolymph 65 kDa lectin BG06 [Biomphalaria glabrata]
FFTTFDKDNDDQQNDN